LSKGRPILGRYRESRARARTAAPEPETGFVSFFEDDPIASGHLGGAHASRFFAAPNDRQKQNLLRRSGY
jgi:hypothetical protein